MAHQAVVIAICVMCLGATMIAVEQLRPGHTFPKVAGWPARAIVINAFQIGAVYLAGLVWNGWMLGHRLWSADRLGTSAGALLGYLCLTLVYYCGICGVIARTFCGDGCIRSITARSASKL